MSQNPIGNIETHPRLILANSPTPIEEMPNLAEHIGDAQLFIKRDDYTGLAFGGNKLRQLEYYFGKAKAQSADTILITGATQSNFARLTAAAACKNNMECHIQVEHRVANTSNAYLRSGNILLSRLLGATLHEFPHGEEEAAADANLEAIAKKLKDNGNTPYVIHLGVDYPPLGALGYIDAAHELHQQMADQNQMFDEIIIASGSGATHAGLLFGLRALGCDIPVKGICVRRAKEQQRIRIISHCAGIAKLLGIDNPVTDSDIELNDDALAPGYGKLNDKVREAIKLTAQNEGIFLDPVYTGRTMAGFIDRAKLSQAGQKLLYIHTGGQPAIFAYEDQLQSLVGGET